jgi:2-amino-4-hydroxy-6-hydroxymethyldihydropteridine diphosphokinase
MNTAYLLTGGNIGDRQHHLRMAATFIYDEVGPITRSSSLYETGAWGMKDQPSFLNQALRVETSLSPIDLLRATLSIEEKLGRIRKEKMGPRIIDIDILLYNNDIVSFPELEIPHPQMVYRRFVLAPVQEIAAGYVHPVLHKTIEQLLVECADDLAVYKYVEGIEEPRIS